MALDAKEKKKPGRPTNVQPLQPADPIYTDEYAAANMLGCYLRILQEKFRTGEIIGYKKLGKRYTMHSDSFKYLKIE
ncbi:hypothetical protein [Adhaeribacter aquaticus]|uniref:hypothetical protein n=1 Tax=Adhaeribacter aquaticus TaxID=299567 RepID=UPI000418864D|nr:hypothetical protein [Adhaeribacter aquaticus]